MVCNINIKKLPWFHENTLKQGSGYSTGFDLATSLCYALRSGDQVTIQTGLCVEFPFNFEASIRPRSSLSSKGLWCAYGTIDADYRGELKVTLFNLSGNSYQIEAGDRIAQICFNEKPTVFFHTVGELSITDRGDQGFGSSGK